MRQIIYFLQIKFLITKTHDTFAKKTTMKSLIALFLIVLLLACSGKTNSGKNPTSPDFVVINEVDMHISEIEKDDDGYLVLFNGKHANGWRGYGQTNLPDKWKVMDGSLILKQPEGNGGDIIFKYKFKNFDLELDWKIAKTGNSGIFYLAREVVSKNPTSGEDKLQPIYVSAPEYQILDNERHPDAKLGKNGNRKAGSLYDMIPAVPQTAKPYGEWNNARIVVNKGIVSHWLNGVKVVEYSFMGEQWIDLLQSGKFGQNKWPLAFELMKNCGGEKHEGYIGLQDVGYEVSFKNIRLKILP